MRRPALVLVALSLVAACLSAQPAAAATPHVSLKKVGVTAGDAVVFRDVLAVEVTAKRKVKLRLAVVQGTRMKARATLAFGPGTQTVPVRLNRAPQGTSLRLRVTAARGRKTGRKTIKLLVVLAPATPVPAPPPPPPQLLPPPPPPPPPPGSIFLATATLGNGASYTGAGRGSAVSSHPLVSSTVAAAAAADANDARLCVVGTLDPAKVAGKIVVCDDGTNPRLDKSMAVSQAGGVGMILANTAPGALVADSHFVPTVHVDETAGAAVKTYAGTSSPTASLSQSVEIPPCFPRARC